MKNLLLYNFWNLIFFVHIFIPPYNHKTFVNRDYKIALKMKKYWKKMYPDDDSFGVVCKPGQFEQKRNLN